MRTEDRRRWRGPVTRRERMTVLRAFGVGFLAVSVALFLLSLISPAGAPAGFLVVLGPINWLVWKGAPPVVGLVLLGIVLGGVAAATAFPRKAAVVAPGGLATSLWFFFGCAAAMTLT